MADVFISYSKADHAIAKALADDLVAAGFEVWWDFQLYAGDDFHDMIRNEIAKAKAVIVIWSETAVASKWVRGEAVEASEHGTLISTHIPGFDPRKVPINFKALHCEPVSNQERIFGAVERKGASKERGATHPMQNSSTPEGSFGVAEGWWQRFSAVFLSGPRRTQSGEAAIAQSSLRARAERGDGMAQHNLGCLYLKGSSEIAKDEREAARLFQLAANQGVAPAQCALGYLYSNGLGGLTQDYAEAARLFKLAADQGDAQGQTYLAVCYRRGLGVAKSDHEAARLLKLAASQGHAEAQYELSSYYFRGTDRKNREEGWRLVKCAADQGLADAQVELGMALKKGGFRPFYYGGISTDDAKAVEYFKLAARSGDPSGQYYLAWFYEDGRGGLPMDRAEAIRLYKLAARQGYRGAIDALRRLEATPRD